MDCNSCTESMYRNFRGFDPATWAFANTLRSSSRSRSEPARRRPLRWPPFRDDGGDEILRVVKVDMKLKTNGPLHRTDKFDLMTREQDPHLVIRRGQNFHIEIAFNRPFKDTDGVSILFSIADGIANLSHGTLIVVPLVTKKSSYESPDEWHAYIDRVDGRRVTVQLKASASCPIGKWKIAMDTKLKSSQSAVSYALPQPIYILYNPWHPDDDVYLSLEEARNEYILEDSGLIWRGSHNSLRPSPWTYGQFEPDILDCALHLINKSLKPRSRGDCIKIVRTLAALVNSNDDEGVTVGNWGKDFGSYTPPYKWTGSAKILQEYFKTKVPVRYAQCWVFAGVLATVCRAIGVPCRVVTNFSSAHDTQSSLTVDYFVDENGKPVEDLNTDSIWNFHVWNEVWMKREDMGDERYWGWQAIDSTPQEQSEGIYRLGPASVEACRRGEIKRHYDVGFLFSEVNADKVYWRYQGPTQPLKLLSRKPDRSSVGMKISTKAIGKYEREDITYSYKHAENSNDERDAMLKALKQSESLYSRYYLNAEFSDVRFDLELLDDIVIGSPFKVVLYVTNVSDDKEHAVEGFIRVDSMLYTGKLGKLVTKHKFSLKLPPKSEEEVVLEITYNEYSKAMETEGAFNIACLATVPETDFEYFGQDDFRVRKPDIKFMIDDGTEAIFVDQPVKGTVSLKNPLPLPLRRCRFYIDAPGFGRPVKMSLENPIKPGEVGTADFELIPKIPGERTITAKFNSLELQDVDGFLVVTVNPYESNEIVP